MNSKECLYLLMTNQKKVRDGFNFVDLHTLEKVSIEECYEIVMEDLEKLEQENKELKESKEIRFVFGTYFKIKPATYKLKIDGDNVIVEKEKEDGQN